MDGIFTLRESHTSKANVGRYDIHGSYGEALQIDFFLCFFGCQSFQTTFLSAISQIGT